MHTKTGKTNNLVNFMTYICAKFKQSNVGHEKCTLPVNCTDLKP